MNLKTLLKTLDNISYTLVDWDGNYLESDYIADQYYGESEAYENQEVILIKIIDGLNPGLLITIK